MTSVAIVFHSGFGHTKALARSVVRGAESVADTEVTLLPVEEVDAHWDTLDAADAIIFGAPTYMGSASAGFKSFMDASSKKWATGAWKDKIAAGFTNSASLSGDKLNTLVQLAIFAAQHGMVWIGTGLRSGFNSTTSSPDTPNRLGSFLGVMAQSNTDQGAEVAPPAVDHATGELLGQRVAEAAARWRRGNR